jgi:hypothetical protein
MDVFPRKYSLHFLNPARPKSGPLAVEAETESQRLFFDDLVITFQPKVLTSRTDSQKEYWASRSLCREHSRVLIGLHTLPKSLPGTAMISDCQSRRYHHTLIMRD